MSATLSANNSTNLFETVLVLDDNDVNLGKMSYKEARNLAEQSGLDTVLINSQGPCKVFKITDEGRYKYLQKKGHKKQVVRKQKEMNYNVRTEHNDLIIKTNKVKEFLGEGDDVLLVINMKGREKGNPELAKEKLNCILTLLDGQIKSESVKATNNSVSVVVHPVPSSV